MEPSLSKERLLNLSSVTDADLLYALQGRQMSALKALYQRYGGAVYGMALKVLKTSHEAEDLAQEVFLELWYHPPKPDHPHIVRYLVAMTRSRAIDKLRSRHRQWDLLQRFNEVTPLESVSLYEQAALTEQAQHIQQALIQLPDNQRQVIEMAYNEGLSQSEIARQLNTPLGTVKTWTRQALLQLRQLLQTVITGDL